MIYILGISISDAAFYIGTLLSFWLLLALVERQKGRR